MKTPGPIEKWIVKRRAELAADAGKKARLFIVPKRTQEPEQLDLDFAGENQCDVERTISAILEHTENRRKLKVG